MTKTHVTFSPKGTLAVPACTTGYSTIGLQLVTAPNTDLWATEKRTGNACKKCIKLADKIAPRKAANNDVITLVTADGYEFSFGGDNRFEMAELAEKMAAAQGTPLTRKN